MSQRKRRIFKVKNASSCPSDDQLRQLLNGGLTGELEAETAQHIEGCATCQLKLEALAPSPRELLPGGTNGQLEHESLEPSGLDGATALAGVFEQLRDLSGRPVSNETETRSNEDLNASGSDSELIESLVKLDGYEVIEVVGRGGMGTVFKAIDSSLDRVVALKILAPMLASNATARVRFIREARSAAAVVHDHVVTIHAVDESEGQPYLVMQYVLGISLQEKLDRTGPLEVKEILRIAKQIAGGLAAAHEQGLVHRDIKPSNVLLENGVERVKITDFGLARAADDASLTHSQVIAGTPQYMAPEQANGQVVDHRADLFSLGSVMYAMCTGVLPFRAENTMATLRAVSESEPRPIRQLNPEVPQPLVDIIGRLHAKDPGDRFQSAEELERALADELAQLQMPLRTTGPAAYAASNTAEPHLVEKDMPAKRQTTRSRLAFTFAMGMLLLLIGLGLAETAGATHVFQSLATVFRFETPQGTVVVEVDDPSASVTLDGEVLSIGAEGFKELKLNVGSYEFGTVRDGVLEKSTQVTVAKDSKEIVRVGFEKRADVPAEPRFANEEERRILAERVEILKQRAELLQEQFHTGNTSLDLFIRASNDLLDAELELAAERTQRIVILRQRLANMNELEAAADARYRTGVGGLDDVLAVKAERIAQEQQLNREIGSQIVRAPSPAANSDLTTTDAKGVLKLRGRVIYDPKHRVEVLSPLPAFIERNFVNEIGTAVRKGDALVEIKSGAFTDVQASYLKALQMKQDDPDRQDAIAAAHIRLLDLGITQEQIDALEERNKAAGVLTLFAPVDGVIVAHNREPGALLDTNSSILTLADPNKLKIQLSAVERDLVSMRFGQNVSVHVDAYPNEYLDGKICKIAPRIDFADNEVAVDVELDAPALHLRPGMTVTGTLLRP